MKKLILVCLIAAMLCAGIAFAEEDPENMFSAYTQNTGFEAEEPSDSINELFGIEPTAEPEEPAAPETPAETAEPYVDPSILGIDGISVDTPVSVEEVLGTMSSYMLVTEKAPLYQDKTMSAAAGYYPQYSCISVVMDGDFATTVYNGTTYYIQRAYLVDPMEKIPTLNSDGTERQYAKAQTTSGCSCFIYPSNKAPATALQSGFNCEMIITKGQWAFVRGTENNIFGYIPLKNLQAVR